MSIAIDQTTPASFPLLDDERLSYPGHPNADQLNALDCIADADPEAIIIGWHYPLKGPLVVMGDDTWLVVMPNGRDRCIVMPLS